MTLQSASTSDRTVWLPAPKQKGCNTARGEIVRGNSDGKGPTVLPRTKTEERAAFDRHERNSREQSLDEGKPLKGAG